MASSAKQPVYLLDGRVVKYIGEFEGRSLVQPYLSGLPHPDGKLLLVDELLEDPPVDEVQEEIAQMRRQARKELRGLDMRLKTARAKTEKANDRFVEAQQRVVEANANIRKMERVLKALKSEVGAEITRNLEDSMRPSDDR